MTNRFARWLFSFVWRRWLAYDSPVVPLKKGLYWKVVKVKDWRTALLDAPSGGSRVTMSCCFWIFK